MGLTLSVLRCPDAVPPETRQVGGGEFSIGRGVDNSWTLTDPDRTLSRRHCVIAFRGGAWMLADVSANGTFLNREAEAVGEGNPRDLRDGDRIRLGAYEIEVRLSEEAWAPGGDAAGGGRDAGAFGDDPFAPAPARDQGFDRAPADDLGFVRRDGRDSGFEAVPPARDEGGFRSATQPDNAPALSQAMRVTAAPKPGLDDWDLDFTAPAGGGAPPSPAAGQADGGLSDWDLDLPQATPEPVAPVPAAPAPRVAPVEEEVAGADPFAEPERDAPAAPVPAPVASPVAAPTGASPPVAASAALPMASAAGTDLLAAFLRGAGMEDARPADPVAAMERLGSAFRAVVTGLRQALMARAAVKGEFRIEQTMIRAKGNNPLKFSAGDDDALVALLGVGRRVDMAPAAAVAEALEDMRLHELAVMAAMQRAVREVVARFDPAPLRAEGDKSGGMLGAQKRARSFELFEKLHGEISAALADDFESVFGRAFARAYEQALREVGDRGRG